MQLSRYELNIIMSWYKYHHEVFDDEDSNRLVLKIMEELDGSIPYKEIIDHLNNRLGTRYRHTTNKTRTLIKARWNEGFRLEDFFNVIDKKCVEWIGNKKMEKFLRPETLFGTKFEGYLNQLSVQNEDTSNQLEQLMAEARQGNDNDDIL